MGKQLPDLTPAELAARWDGDVAQGTLANWRSLGTGPGYIKRGRRVRYPMASVLAYEKENTHLAPKEKGSKEVKKAKVMKHG